MTALAKIQLTTAEATALTERIREAVDGLWSLLLEAHDRGAWKALGYGTWAEYVQTEFGMGRQYSYRLLDQGRVIQAIEEATGGVSPNGDISEAAARDIKADLPAVTADIKERVEKGEDPKKATDEAVKAAREKAKAEREAKQAEHNNQRQAAAAALPDAIKEREAAKAEAIAARKNGPTDADAVWKEGLVALIAEVREANASLEAENAALKSENAKYADMKAEFERGGFEEVIKGKDAVIAAQASRIERESQEKVANLRSSDWWRKKALELGYTDREIIEING